jgi:AAA domain
MKIYDIIQTQVSKNIYPVVDDANNKLEEFKPELETLSEDQQEALSKILFSLADSVVISGNAGTGKTTVQHLASKILTQVFDCEVVKTAAFGIAALNMGGSTISSTFGLMINHVLPWVDGEGVLDYRKFERDYGNPSDTKSYSTRQLANDIYGKFKRLKVLRFTKPIFWFNDEFSTVTSEQFIVCWQILQRLNPNIPLKVVAFGQPIQMLSPNINSDTYGLNKHSRAWESAKFVSKGYYTSEELYPLDEDNPEIYKDERKARFDIEKELNHVDAGGAYDRQIKFNPTEMKVFGSLFVNGQGPFIAKDNQWKVIYHCLTTNHRQGEEKAFADICTAIADCQLIKSNEFWKPLLDRVTSKIPKSFEDKAVWLVRTHKKKEIINDRFLKEAIRKHPKETVTLYGWLDIAGHTGYVDNVDTKKRVITFIDPETKVTTQYNYSHLEYANRVSNFFSYLTIPVKQVLAPNLPVISRLNNKEYNIANGTVGHIVSTNQDSLTVYRPDLDQEVTWRYIEPNYIPRKRKGDKYFGYKTIPCHQANAMTFQACQGLTITSLGVIDVDIEMLKGEKGLNSAGAMYVNLTRFTSLSNLYIKVPNDSFSDAHKLNEVIFMDASSVEFMKFIIQNTQGNKSEIFNSKETIKLVEEEPMTVETIKSPHIYKDGEYYGDRIEFTHEGELSQILNLREPSSVHGFSIFEKESDDDAYDAIVWLDSEKYNIGFSSVYPKIDAYLKSKGYEDEYIYYILGLDMRDSLVKDTPEIKVVKEENELSSSSTLKSLLLEMEKLKAENAELKELVKNSVSKQEFNALQSKLGAILDILKK